MRETLQRRLEDLRQEYELGKAKARELEKQQTQLQQTMLRISGAIQVLEEELSAQPADAAEGSGAAIPLESARQFRRP